MKKPIFIEVTDRFSGLPKMVNVCHIIHFGSRHGDDSGTEIVTSSQVERVQAVEPPPEIIKRIATQSERQ